VAITLGYPIKNPSNRSTGEIKNLVTDPALKIPTKTIKGIAKDFACCVEKFLANK
jgi:hypothetical protein